MVNNVHKLESSRTKIHLKLKFQHSNICLNFEVSYLMFFLSNEKKSSWVHNLIIRITSIYIWFCFHKDWSTNLKGQFCYPRFFGCCFFFFFLFEFMGTQFDYWTYEDLTIWFHFHKDWTNLKVNFVIQWPIRRSKVLYLVVFFWSS